mgnify:CR=1 FL=1
MEKPLVVVAEEDARFRSMLIAALEGRGFEVMAMGVGVSVEDMPAVLSPRAFLLSLPGPVEGGPEAIRRVLAAWPSCKVVILAGHGGESTARKARESGAFDYLCAPCDAQTVASRVAQAVAGPTSAGGRERTVTEIMIPIDDYTCVQASCTVREGIEKLRIASENFISSGLVMDSGHRAVLVFEGEELAGVLTMRNLIQAVRPEFLASRSVAASRCLRYSQLFWAGLFNAGVHALEDRCVREIMNPKPPVVDCEANLMQVAHLLCEENRRRVVVQREGRIIGVVREQELFREISRLMLHGD